MKPSSGHKQKIKYWSVETDDKLAPGRQDGTLASIGVGAAQHSKLHIIIYTSHMYVVRIYNASYLYILSVPSV